MCHVRPVSDDSGVFLIPFNPLAQEYTNEDIGKYMPITKLVSSEKFRKLFKIYWKNTCEICFVKLQVMAEDENKDRRRIVIQMLDSNSCNSLYNYLKYDRYNIIGDEYRNYSLY